MSSLICQVNNRKVLIMSFTYTGPGYYVTRDGAKAIVGELRSGAAWFYGYVENYGGVEWTKDGKARTNGYYDLVGPWVEPPKPLEIWINETQSGTIVTYRSRSTAGLDAHGRLKNYYKRIAVHMKEVTDETK